MVLFPMKRYREIGIRLTPQRIAILNYLEGNKNHPSADEIYKAVSRKFPTMSFATVYSALATLRDAGNVVELTIDPMKKRYDPNTERHHHLTCVSCKRFVDVLAEFKIELPESLKQDFEVTTHHIEFNGLCPECRKTT
jgi:Fur family peroxide stress response transcriptional regulator